MCWWMLLACVKAPTMGAPIPSEAMSEVMPQEGWYDAACYAALDGNVDVALHHLQRAIENGAAPLGWMGEDPDLASVRADPRFVDVRDAAIDHWVATQPPADGDDWLQVARARMLQGRDLADALRAAEAAGVTYPVFGCDFPPVTPAVADCLARREAWVADRRGSVTVENPAAFELATIVLSLTAYGQDANATDRSTAYSAEVDAWFAPYRDHPLIQELDALPVDMGVYYAFRNQSAAWTLHDGTLVPSEVYVPGSFWAGTDPFADRLARIEDFVRVSDAATFIGAHQEAYAARVDAYEAAVPIQAMWDWLESRFPAEGDGRDALVVRTSMLIGGSHNASTLRLGDFTEGTMVVPVFVDGETIAPEDAGPLARMVFTEIDHHYVNPVSDRMRPAIDAAVADYGAFNEKAELWGYDSPYLTFNEYATWVLFDVWWVEHCEAVACSEAQRSAGSENTARVMKRRGFHRYEAFRDAMVPQLVGAEDMDAMFPLMLDWFRQQGAGD